MATRALADITQVAYTHDSTRLQLQHGGAAAHSCQRAGLLRGAGATSRALRSKLPRSWRPTCGPRPLRRRTARQCRRHQCRVYRVGGDGVKNRVRVCDFRAQSRSNVRVPSVPLIRPGPIPSVMSRSPIEMEHARVTGSLPRGRRFDSERSAFLANASIAYLQLDHATSILPNFASSYLAESEWRGAGFFVFWGESGVPLKAAASDPDEVAGIGVNWGGVNNSAQLIRIATV